MPVSSRALVIRLVESQGVHRFKLGRVSLIFKFYSGIGFNLKPDHWHRDRGDGPGVSLIQRLGS